MTDAELRDAVRRALETVGDSVGPARSFDEISGDISGARTPPPPSPRGDGRAARILVAAVAAAIVAVLIGSLSLLDNDAEPPPIGGPGGTTPASTVAVGTSPLSTVAGTAPPSTLGSTTTLRAVLTIEDVRAGQVEALRGLPGFVATAEFTQSLPTDVEPSFRRVSEITLLPDGSFWSQTGPEEWGSYDPVTATVRGAFKNPDGTFQYQELVGQQDNSVPLGVLSGMFPTQLVQPAFGENLEVVETTFEGRSVWEITTVMTVPGACQGDCPSNGSQTDVRTIDRATGLVIRSSVTSTNPNSVSQTAVLRNIRPVDAMPAAFPGTFPEGVTIDRSGAPLTVDQVVITDLPDHFAIPLPLPTGFDDARVTIQADLTTPDLTGVEPIVRAAEVRRQDGFLATTVQISATLRTDGSELLCASEDSTCTFDLTTVPLSDGQRLVTITDGALAGSPAVVGNGTVRLITGSLNFNIAAPTDTEALAVANSLQAT